MKKLIAMLLALVMICSLATVAFATTNDPTFNNKDNQDLTDYLDKPGVISKEYKINSGEAPAETFTFAFAPYSYKHPDADVAATDDATKAKIPAIANQTISFGAINATAGDEKEFAIDASKYDLGVYTYEVTEVKPTAPTTGVTYSTEKLYLVLTILRDERDDAVHKHYVAAIHYQSATGEKTNKFTNEYDSGSLAITKEITGNMAEMSKEFNFTVKFNVPAAAPTGGHVISTNIGGVTGTLTLADNLTHNFTLGHKETATFTNLPVGTTYTIYEDKENYDQKTVTGETVTDGDNDKTVTGAIAKGDADTAKYVNELKTTVDTGIALDSAPYFLMLAVAVVGMVALVSKKRYEV